MEIAENGIASGSIRDLPPSKRFKFVNAGIGSTPSLPLPVKNRVLPPPAAVPVCLPVKKISIVASPPEDAAPVCLPVKKRAYAPPADAVKPACLPAKKRAYTPPPPPDTVAWSCVPTKKRVHTPRPRDDAACSVPVSLPATKHVHAPPRQVHTTGSLPACLPSEKCIHAPPSREAAEGSVPVCLPAKKHVHPPPRREDAACSVPVCLPSKKRDHAPPPRRDAAGSVPVCLPTNKRVMLPLPSPSVESKGALLAAINPRLADGIEGCAKGKEFKKPAINPRLADRADGCAKGKEFKKPEKPTNPKEIKEQLSRKPSKSRSPSKATAPEKKACKVANGRQSEAEVEVRKKAVKATNAKPAAREESWNAADEAAREREQEAAEEDDGVLCAVCGSTDGDPSDPIVFCDGCDLMVHASCYGNPLAQCIPDGDWFCSLCSAKKIMPAARPRCCLCPARGGAMKRTTEGPWAHIACALLVPEVFFRDPDGREGIDCSRVPAHRFTKECYICESSSGCALECSQPKCSLGFHVCCGLNGGLCIEYREEKGGAIVAGFCTEHTELWEKQQLTGKYKIVARG